MVERVVVIGGGSGIGKAVAASAKAAGMEVIIAACSADRLRKVARELGSGVQARPLDVTDADAVRAFFDACPPFAHLVYSAGMSRSGPFGMLGVRAAKAVFETKFWGAYACCEAARTQVRQSITLVSGIAARKPFPGLHAMAAANGALEALARSMAIELAPIRVNVVAPGLVDTPAYADMPREERNAMFVKLGERLPSRRVGQPEDIALACLSLMQNAYISGSVLDVDGGHRLI